MKRVCAHALPPAPATDPAAAEAPWIGASCCVERAALTPLIIHRDYDTRCQGLKKLKKVLGRFLGCASEPDLGKANQLNGRGPKSPATRATLQPHDRQRSETSNPQPESLQQRHPVTGADSIHASLESQVQTSQFCDEKRFRTQRSIVIWDPIVRFSRVKQGSST